MARSLKPLEPGLNAVVRMYDHLVGGATTFGSHRQSVDDESSIGTGVDRPTHCHLRTGVEYDTAKDLAFSSWVLGDVGDPELVRQISRELSINQILWGGQWWDIVTFAPSGDALNIGALHNRRHGTVAHLDPQPLREVRVHPHCPVNATSISVHLANDVSEPRVRTLRTDGTRLRSE